jgi:3-methyladenine DNA glycosylase AlkD
MYFKKFPEQKYMYFEKWKTSKNMWLNRISIIFQLHYKQSTDFELIKEAIVSHENSKEFFIRKAAGWALRTYSRYEPKKILDFIDEHPNLSGLTKREAIRNINL